MNVYAVSRFYLILFHRNATACVPGEKTFRDKSMDAIRTVKPAALSAQLYVKSRLLDIHTNVRAIVADKVLRSGYPDIKPHEESSDSEDVSVVADKDETGASDGEEFWKEEDTFDFGSVESDATQGISATSANASFDNDTKEDEATDEAANIPHDAEFKDEMTEANDDDRTGSASIAEDIDTINLKSESVVNEIGREMADTSLLDEKGADPKAGQEITADEQYKSDFVKKFVTEDSVVFSIGNETRNSDTNSASSDNGSTEKSRENEASVIHEKVEATTSDADVDLIEDETLDDSQQYEAAASVEDADMMILDSFATPLDDVASDDFQEHENPALLENVEATTSDTNVPPIDVAIDDLQGHEAPADIEKVQTRIRDAIVASLDDKHFDGSRENETPVTPENDVEATADDIGIAPIQGEDTNDVHGHEAPVVDIEETDRITADIIVALADDVASEESIHSDEGYEMSVQNSSVLEARSASQTMLETRSTGDLDVVAESKHGEGPAQSEEEIVAMSADEASLSMTLPSALESELETPDFDTTDADDRGIVVLGEQAPESETLSRVIGAWDDGIGAGDVESSSEDIMTPTRNEASSQDAASVRSTPPTSRRWASPGPFVTKHGMKVPQKGKRPLDAFCDRPSFPNLLEQSAPSPLQPNHLPNDERTLLLSTILVKASRIGKEVLRHSIAFWFGVNGTWKNQEMLEALYEVWTNNFWH